MFYRPHYLVQLDLQRYSSIHGEMRRGVVTHWGSNKITSTKVGTIMTNYSKQHTNPVNNFRKDDAVTLVNFMVSRGRGDAIA